ncbi:winged helix-turn-helix transcriptional regulator [Erysipelothrix urinaevulpis]|nr:winged helix-turn-helix transcriptional regulator [Erysipelothrix urinaevulpis]
MTNKEKLIYHILLENPMLSQEEIAYRANMSRSSVSVHISNLMSKGIIVGRSYVVQDTGYIVILGESIVEINGMLSVESNKETIDISVKGSGMTISQNFHQENITSHLITTVPNSFFGTLVQNWCSSIGIDLKYSYFSKEDYNNLCMSLDREGDYHQVIHDNKAMDALPINHLLNQDRLLRDSSLILIGSYFNIKATEYALERYSDKKIMLSFYEGFDNEKMILLMEKANVVHCSIEVLKKVSLVDTHESSVFKEMKKLLNTKTVLVCVNDSNRLFIMSHDYKEMFEFKSHIKEKEAFDHISSGIAMSIIKKYDYEQMAFLALKNIEY